MTFTVTLSIEYISSDEAQHIADALKPDNKDYIVVRVYGNTLEATATANTAGSLRHTLDDFLACLALAELTREVLK